MSQATADFTGLLARARDGDPEALAELVRQYEPEVRIVARVLLGPALRPYLDSLDLVQSVHRSLLLGLRHGKVDVSSPERLVALATTMVRRKIARQWRRLQRQKRVDVEGDAGSLACKLAELSRSTEDPAGAAQLHDSLRHLCEHLDGAERRMLELRLEGHSTAEVARQLGLDADVLRVRLSRLRQRLRDRGVLEEFL
jgi:RNA polymerase sigma-70 factor (ECF subfamily)